MSQNTPVKLIMHSTEHCTACRSVGSSLGRKDISFEKVVYTDAAQPELIELKTRLGVDTSAPMQFPVMEAVFADGDSKLMRAQNMGGILDLVKEVQTLYPEQTA